MNMFPDSVKRGQGVESIVCLFDMLLACCSVPSFLLDFSNAWLGRQGMVGARRLIGEGGKREGKGRVKGRLGVRPVNAVRLSRLIHAVSSVAAVQSGAVQVETCCQLVLNKFTPVHTGATWRLLANQSAGPWFEMQPLLEVKVPVST